MGGIASSGEYTGMKRIGGLGLTATSQVKALNQRERDTLF